MHKEISNIFLKIAERDEAPMWGRFSAILCGVSFANSNSEIAKFEKAKDLLDKTNNSLISPRLLHEIRDLLPLSPPIAPWRKKI